MQTSQENNRILIRFSVLHRLLHWVVMLGFIGLALTGFSLKFSSQGWARAIVFFLGGPERFGYWHPFFAALTYGGVMVHLFWLLYFKALLKGRLTGPQSLFPRAQDALDLVQHLRYFIGRGQTPSFNRFAYWEKIDYWAILIGMNTMGLTGLVLLYPEFFATLIPGYFINLAQVLHFYEAVMAVALKFVVHILTAHLRPEIFPMDKTIFTGKTTGERLMREHPKEWATLRGAAGPDVLEAVAETVFKNPEPATSPEGNGEA